MSILKTLSLKMWIIFFLILSIFWATLTSYFVENCKSILAIWTCLLVYLSWKTDCVKIPINWNLWINLNFYAIYFTGYNKQEAMGLYRDDGLIILSKVTSQNTDKIRKKIIHVFKGNGFSIGIVTNLVKVNFLEVTLNLRNGS